MRLLLILVLTATVYGQTDDSRRTTHPELFALTELARSAPPEFAAYALLQILEAGAVPTNEWRLELAREALTLANSARHRQRKRLAPGVVAMDNRAMLWHVAYNRGLDGLTLSMRAIEQIRRDSREEAKKAFAAFPRPVAGRTSCKEAMIDDISAWYGMAMRLQSDPLPLIQSIQSNGEIAPAIDMIFATGALDVHAGALAGKLRELPAEGRAFEAALVETPGKIKHLYRVLESRQRPTAALGDAWRAWMQMGLEATACQEVRVAGAPEQARREAFELMNRTLTPPLSPDLLKPGGSAEPTDVGTFADTEATREQARLFRQLLFGGHSRGLTDAEKSTPEWQEQMQKYLQSIESRTQTADESAMEFFYRQSQLWAGALMVSPAGSTRNRALQQYISFLLLHAPDIDPIVWFSQVEAMAEITRSLHGDEFAKTLQALHQTAHPVLRLYAELETAYPTRPGPKVN